MAGLKIGEVEALSGVVNFDEYGDSRVRLNVNISVQPARLGLPGEAAAMGADAAAELKSRGGSGFFDA